MSFVFLFKTSRDRTTETSRDYCKLGSGDIFKCVHVCVCQVDMRALYAASKLLQKQEKYLMGDPDHVKIHCSTPLLVFFF